MLSEVRDGRADPPVKHSLTMRHAQGNDVAFLDAKLLRLPRDVCENVAIAFQAAQKRDRHVKLAASEFQQPLDARPGSVQLGCTNGFVAFRQFQADALQQALDVLVRPGGAVRRPDGTGSHTPR